VDRYLAANRALWDKWTGINYRSEFYQVEAFKAGFFYITEVHPVAQVFDDDEGITDLRLRYPYFTHADPLTFETQGSYADRSAQVSQRTEYGWNHGLGEIVTALAGEGLRIDFLHEFPFVEWPVSFLRAASDGTYRLPPEHDGQLPLFFSLKASRPT
jgi:hypothetical protein